MMGTQDMETVTLGYAYGLTPEDYEKLGAPIPQHMIKSYEGRGGKQMRYVEVEVVEDRIREVDPNFSRHVQDGPHGITVHYTIKGVTRGDTFDANDEAKYGTPATTAFAHAARRAGKAFGIAKELWQDEPVEEKPATRREAQAVSQNIRKPYSNQAAQSNRGGASQGGRTAPSEKQVQWLTETLRVPMDIVSQLNAAGGKESEASRLMNALFQRRNADQKGYDRNPAPYVESALAEVGLDSLLDDVDLDPRPGR